MELLDRTTEQPKKRTATVPDDVQSRYQDALAHLNEATDEELVRARRIMEAQEKLAAAFRRR